MIKNSTIKKLDMHEIAELGLYNHGIYTFKGQVKSRVKGLKVTYRADDEVHFEGDHLRWEVIQIVATNDEGVNEYAIRCFSKDKNEYVVYMILSGVDFMR